MTCLLPMSVYIRAILCAAFTLPPLAYAQTSHHSWAYKPFSITSTKLKKEMGVDQIERTFVCKTAMQSFHEMSDLMQSYDFRGVEVSSDGTTSTANFLGKQEGKTVLVELIVNRSTQRLTWVNVNGRPTLDCIE